MNPELPPDPRAELEAKVTAWLLGELSAEEAASVQETVANDPELARLRDRLSLTVNLLRETVSEPAPLKLSPARREKLLAQFKTVAPKEFAQSRSKIYWLIPLAAAAGIALLIFFISTPLKPVTRYSENQTLNFDKSAKSVMQEKAPAPPVVAASPVTVTPHAMAPSAPAVAAAPPTPAAAPEPAPAPQSVGSLASRLDAPISQPQIQEALKAQAQSDGIATPSPAPVTVTAAVPPPSFQADHLDAKAAYGNSDPGKSALYANQNAPLEDMQKDQRRLGVAAASVRAQNWNAASEPPAGNAPIGGAANLQNGFIRQAPGFGLDFMNAFDYRDPEPPPGAPIAFLWEHAADPFIRNCEALRISVKAAAPIRETDHTDLRVHVEFNAKRVTSYRQIGYVKEQIQSQIAQNSNGSAEKQNELYAVQVNRFGKGPIATVQVAYHVPGSADYQQREWTIPYAGKPVALEKASPALRLAVTAATYSEWINGGPEIGNVTPEKLLRYLRGVPEHYGADTRPKKLEELIRQTESAAGK